MLIATTDQLTAAAALIELDGVARRIVLCPPDLPLEYLPAIVRSAAVNAIVSDRLATADEIPGITSFIHPDGKIVPGDRGATRHETEWILLTSGTTGVPKLVVAHLSYLAGAIEIGGPERGPDGVEHVLRHSPLWRSADISARDPDRQLAACCRALMSLPRISWLAPVPTE